MKSFFGIELDDLFDGPLWDELERIQDGRSGHRIAIQAQDKHAAALRLSEKLVGFFSEHMYLCDEYGRPTE